MRDEPVAGLEEAVGESYFAVCAECGTESEVWVGGGFFFHLFRCNRCGKQRSANFDELSALHEKHLKGHPGSWPADIPGAAEALKNFSPCRPMDDAKYRQRLEKLLGACGCAGTFRMNAPPRCPKCRSNKLVKTGKGLLYD